MNRAKIEAALKKYISAHESAAFCGKLSAAFDLGFSPDLIRIGKSALDEPTPAAAPPAPAAACQGVPDPRCNYTMSCGQICNKCGRIHNPMLYTLQSAPAAVPDDRADKLQHFLGRSLKLLDAWGEAYGEHQPEWLPPAGEIQLREQIAEWLAAAQTKGRADNDQLKPPRVSAVGLEAPVGREDGE